MVNSEGCMNEMVTDRLLSVGMGHLIISPGVCTTDKTTKLLNKPNQAHK